MSTFQINNIMLVDTLLDSIDPSKKLKLSLTNITPSTTRTLIVPNDDTTITGTDSVQTLTNKTIDATLNTITNIGNTNLIAGIDATKIADGTISNAEFQQLNGITSPVVGISDGQTLTNKTIDATLNTITNVGNTNLIAGIDAAKIANGTISNTEFQQLNGITSAVVGISDTQTLTNKTIDATSNTISNIGNAQIITGIDAIKIANGSVSNAEFQRLDGVASNIVGISDTQTLTNKTIDATLNTISNIGNGQIIAGVDAAKIANGTVSNTEFQRLDGVTSSVVGISDTQTLTNKTIDAALNTISNIGNGQIIAGVDAAKIANGTVSNAEFQRLDGVTSSVVGISDTQTLTNKTINAASNTISNIGNTQIIAGVDAAKIANGTVSNAEFQRLDGVTSSVVGISDTQTLTNKTITGTTNTVSANSLKTTTTDVTVSASTAPTANQLLVASSGTAATWRTLPNILNVPLTLSGTIDIFGDSISAGAGITPVSSRWVSQVCTFYGVTENNLAVGGDRTIDGIQRVYGVGGTAPASLGHVDGRQTIFGLGLNDVYGQPTLAYDEIKRTMATLALYCCLPAAAKIDVRTAAATKTGTWANTPAFNKGIFTQTDGSTVTATVNGRYVVWAGTSLNGTSSSARPNFRVRVDGVIINSAMPIIAGATVNGANGGSYITSTWLFDTGVSGSHTLQVERVAQTGIGIPVNPIPNYVDWMGAFNQNHSGANAVFITSPDSTDWEYINGVFAVIAANAGNELKWIAVKKYLHALAIRFNEDFGLPIYYVDMRHTNTHGQKIDDLLHPNINGHTFLANRFISVLSGGLYNQFA